MTPMLEAQNISGLQKEQPLLLLEENLEQLSIGNEEEYGWEDELEELSRRLQEPVNLNAATKRQLEQFPFLTDIQIENLLAYVYIHGQMQTIMNCNWWRRWINVPSTYCCPLSVCGQ